MAKQANGPFNFKINGEHLDFKKISRKNPV